MAGADRHHDVADLARGLLDVADGRAVVAEGQRERIDGRGDLLLVAAPLGRAALGLGGDLLELVLLALELDDLLAQRGELLVHRLELLGLRLRVVAHRADGHALEGGQRVVVAVGGELPAQVLAHLDADLGQQRLDAVLHRDRGLVAEVARQRLGHVAVLGPEGVVDALVEALGHQPRALDEGRVELARGLLELGLDEVGVGARLLAVEHAGADRDRVEHQPRDVLAVLLALARQAHRAARRRRRGRRSTGARRACGPGRRGEEWQLP